MSAKKILILHTFKEMMLSALRKYVTMLMKMTIKFPTTIPKLGSVVRVIFIYSNTPL